jgi:hypothetical protein
MPYLTTNGQRSDKKINEACACLLKNETYFLFILFQRTLLNIWLVSHSSSDSSAAALWAAAAAAKVVLLSTNRSLTTHPKLFGSSLTAAAVDPELPACR